MAKEKKKKRTIRLKVNQNATDDMMYRELTKYNRKDLQRVCITMGIEFHLICEYSNTQLMTWFLNNYANPRDINLLVKYDKWFRKQMIAEGKDPKDPKNVHLFHPAMQMAYVDDVKEGDTLKVLKAKKLKKEPEKKKREIDEKTGVVKGTKKAYTYRLTAKGYSEKKIIKRVLKKFPDANPGSIKIWIKRAIKEK